MNLGVSSKQDDVERARDRGAVRTLPALPPQRPLCDLGVRLRVPVPVPPVSSPSLGRVSSAVSPRPALAFRMPTGGGWEGTTTRPGATEAQTERPAERHGNRGAGMPSAREHCYQLDVCVSPRFIILSVTEFGGGPSRGDAVIGRRPRGGDERPFQRTEVSVFFAQQVRTPGKPASREPGRGHWPGTDRALPGPSGLRAHTGPLSCSAQR